MSANEHELQIVDNSGTAICLWQKLVEYEIGRGEASRLYNDITANGAVTIKEAPPGESGRVVWQKIAEHVLGEEFAHGVHSEVVDEITSETTANNDDDTDASEHPSLAVTERSEELETQSDESHWTDYVGVFRTPKAPTDSDDVDTENFPNPIASEQQTQQED